MSNTEVPVAELLRILHARATQPTLFSTRGKVLMPTIPERGFCTTLAPRMVLEVGSVVVVQVNQVVGQLTRTCEFQGVDERVRRGGVGVCVGRSPNHRQRSPDKRSKELLCHVTVQNVGLKRQGELVASRYGLLLQFGFVRYSLS